MRRLAAKENGRLFSVCVELESDRVRIPVTWVFPHEQQAAVIGSSWIELEEGFKMSSPGLK